MLESEHTPAFNMKVVVRETGLKPDTLRAWERRYGVPKPNRTTGGHRLYSQYQIEMLKWFLVRQEEGMTISHAVDLWQQMVANGEDPFELDREEEIVSVINRNLIGESLTELRKLWLEKCLSFDESGASQILAQAFAQFSIETVCFEILQKNLNKIGQLWYEGEVTVQQEHFSSGLAIRQLEALLTAAAEPTKDVRIIVTCGPQEQHTFSSLLLTLLFRRQGWHVVYLGANVPADRLESIVADVKPNLVVGTAQTLYTAGAILDMARRLVALNVPFGFGGAVFTYLESSRKHMPGYFLGETVEGVPGRIKKILTNDKSVPKAEPVPEAYQTAVSHFIKKRTGVETYVLEHSDLVNLNLGYLQNANHELGNNIEAALKLGDINLLTSNVNWIEGFLMNFHHRMPENVLGNYVSIYRDGLKAHLGEDGELIHNWFSQMLVHLNSKLRSGELIN